MGGLGCVGFVYKIVEITAASSNNGGGRVLGLLCVEADKCNFPHDAHFRMRRASSACGRTFSACGEPAPHAEILLRMRR